MNPFSRLRLRPAGIAVLVGLVALAARVPYALAFAHSPLGRYLYLDERLYDRLALDFLAGRAPSGAFFVEPLYALILASTYAVAGHVLWLVRALQIAGGACVALLCAWLGGRLYGRRGAWICGLAAALYGPLAFYDAMILKTSFEVLALAALAALLVWELDRPSSWPWAASGLLAGCATLLRGNFLLLLLPLGAAAWRAAPLGRWRRLAALGAAAFAALLPLLLFNHARGGAWIVTTGAGMNFYQGNRAGTTGGLEIPEFIQTDPEHEESDSVAEASRRAGRSLSPAEASRFWFAEGRAFVVGQPRAWLRLMLSKTLLFWNRFEAADDLSFDYAREVIPWLWVPCLGFWLVGSFGLAGLLGAVGRGRSRAERWLAALVAVWAASVVIFHVADRYRLAAVPLLIVLGCGAALRLGALWHGEERAALLRGLLVLGVSAAVVNVPVLYPGGQDRAPFDRIMGFGLLEDGRVELAAVYNRRAAESFFRDGRDALERREPVRAEALLRGALEAVPDYPGAHYHRGFALEMLGRRDEAVAEFERAVATESDVPEALTHLGRLRAAAGDPAGAQAALEEALRRQPDRLPAALALGDLLAGERRYSEARAVLERALRAHPEAGPLRERLARLPP